MHVRKGTQAHFKASGQTLRLTRSMVLAQTYRFFSFRVSFVVGAMVPRRAGRLLVAIAAAMLLGSR